jgi:hypothetical protein
MRAVAPLEATGRCAPWPALPPRLPVAAALLLAALAAACVSKAPTSVIAPGHEGAPDVERFLLAPANLAIALRPELEGGVEPVQTQITGYLEQQGRAVERISLPDARHLWEQSIEELAGRGVELDFPTAAESFARKLGHAHDFQALVIPSLLLQKVIVRHRGAEWDGVERRIRLVNIPRRGGGRSSDVLVDGMSTGSLNAVVAVSSLHVMVFSREGRRVFEGRGGLEFLEEIDLAKAAETFHFEIKPRDDLFRDRELLGEAVEIAFTPYLPPLRKR